MKNKMMIDFETLDVANCPVILSMGIVIFDDKQIIDMYSEKISQESCLAIGCTISQETQDWWSRQSVEARWDAFGGTADIEIAMEQLTAMYTQYECIEIWSRGSLADIRWTNNILDKLGMDRPWKHWEEMCLRTLVKSVPKFDLKFKGEKHKALDDAIHQVEEYFYIKNMQATQQQLLIEQGQAFNDLSQKCADLEFKLLQKEAV